MSNIISYINKLPGYKIPDSHFRLGSKIHITHFYYAKRLFQNSFFASRLAFLTAKAILNDHNDKLNEIKLSGLSLIGYGLYSELLISLIEQFIKNKLNSNKVNHDLISDVEEPAFIKNFGHHYKYIIIIVPIGSTFSTAIKIKEFLTENIKDLEILEPYINILHVSHSPESDDDKKDANGIFEIEKTFGWAHKQDNVVFIKEFPEGATKKQIYILSVKSCWYNIKNCHYCSLDKTTSDERPLYITDKSSVTPTLIFGKPMARVYKDANKFILNPKALEYGHLIRDSNHYHHYIEIEDFFHDNIDNIQDWLKYLQTDRDFKNTFNEMSNVFIIAPGHYTNTRFVNLVNKMLFSNAANIIHFNPKSDHIINFSLLYNRELLAENTKIVFIDDTITSGATFRKIHFYIENIIPSTRSFIFDAAIVLLDRSNLNVHNQFLTKILKNCFFSFANLNLPSLKDLDGECPLDIWYKRYNELADNSFLTSMKIHFLSQKDKLEERTIDSSKKMKENKNQEDSRRYTRQVEAIHRIYQWCHNPNNQFGQEYKLWKTSLLEETASPFSNELLKKDSSDDTFLSTETSTLIKVLSHSPFIHYKPIKDNLFKWILYLLKEKIQKIEIELDNNDFNNNSFRDLKYLIRRAGLLNTNFLLSSIMLSFLLKIYRKQGLDKLREDNRKERESINRKIKDIISQGLSEPLRKKIEKYNHEIKRLERAEGNLYDFHIFYTAQIKELLYQNEARSIYLENTINKLMALENYAHAPLPYKQLLRYIKEENGILILNFWRFIRKKLKSVTYERLKREEGIIEIIKGSTVNEYFRAQVLSEFLSSCCNKTHQLYENLPFLIYIKLMHFFEIENEGNDIGLKNIKVIDKTDFIIDHLKRILCDENICGEKKTPSGKSGAFFLVQYKEDTLPFIAYNKGSSGMLDETLLMENFDLREFLNPNEDIKSAKTIIEFSKMKNSWIDLYAVDQNEIGKNYNLSFIPSEYNRLILIRFNNIEIKNEDTSNLESFHDRIRDKGLAIAGFYFISKDDNISDINYTRFLLLLQSPISDFIKRHLKNDEFRDWVEANTLRKLALLSGHSRIMLLNIAKKENENMKYGDIVLNLEHLQTIITLENNIERIAQNGDINEVFDKFYNVKGSPEIDADHIMKIGKMAEEIFSFDEIENNVPCIIKCFIEQDLRFPFHKSLIDIICFEIFVNAKKNRWHFLKEEEIELQDSTFFNCEIEPSIESKCFQVGNLPEPTTRSINQNLLEITSVVKNNKLVLCISNTGPCIESETLECLSKGINPKREDYIAGLKLIQELLRRKEFGNLGTKTVEQIPINKEIGLYKFKTKFTLNKM